MYYVVPYNISGRALVSNSRLGHDGRGRTKLKYLVSPPEGWLGKGGATMTGTGWVNVRLKQAPCYAHSPLIHAHYTCFILSARFNKHFSDTYVLLHTSTSFLLTVNMYRNRRIPYTITFFIHEYFLSNFFFVFIFQVTKFT